MLDPLRPYADVLKLLAALALAGGLFVTGCQHGSDRRAAKDQDAITKADKARAAAEADSAENLRSANGCGLLLEDVNRQTQASIDVVCQALGHLVARIYDSIDSCSYYNSGVTRYRAEARAMVAWHEAVNQVLEQLVLAPPDGIETWMQVRALLPQRDTFACPEKAKPPLDELAPQPVTCSSHGRNGACGEMAPTCYSAQIAATYQKLVRMIGAAVSLQVFAIAAMARICGECAV